MIKLVICEDELQFRIRLKNIVNIALLKNSIEYEILEFEKFSENLNTVINNENCSKIYILDINLKGTTSGLDIARRIRKTDWKSIIIFLSSHSEITQEVVRAKIMPLNFISKYDNWEKTTMESINKAIAIIECNKSISFKSKNIDYRIYLEDILYITKIPNNKKCLIKTSYGDIIVNRNLSDIKPLLDSRFFLTLRNCMVNTTKIVSIDWTKMIISFYNLEKIDFLAKDRKKRLKKILSENK